MTLDPAWMSPLIQVGGFGFLLWLLLRQGVHTDASFQLMRSTLQAQLDLERIERKSERDRLNAEVVRWQEVALRALNAAEAATGRE